MAVARLIGPEAHFKARLAEGRITLQRCEACARTIYYPRMSCPHCGSLNLRFEETPALGTVYAATTVQMPPGHKATVVLVDIDEGVRVIGNAEADASTLPTGMRVRGRVALVADKPPLIVFEAIEGSA